MLCLTYGMPFSKEEKNIYIKFYLAGFDLTVDHPHTNVVKTCQLVKGKSVICSVGKPLKYLILVVRFIFC